MDADVRVGTVVRIELHGRRVGGWVVAERDEPPAGLVLRPIAKVTGWGPPPDVVDLSRWAARRWAGRPAHFLKTATAPVAIRGLPGTVHRVGAMPPESVHGMVAEVWRLPPAHDLLAVVEAVERPALVLAPSIQVASDLARRVGAAFLPRDWGRVRAGGDVIAIGTRAAAWAPLPELASVVVLDGHDEVYQEERAPTWHARDVAAERARRSNASFVVTSPCPDLETLQGRRLVIPDRTDERAGWPVLDVVDRRRDDPRTGLFSERLVGLLRSDRRVVCVLNRKGRARLLACSACADIAHCERCGAAVQQVESALVCQRCGTERPAICSSCGSQRLKNLRAGVSRVREELSALVDSEVGEVTGLSDEVPPTRVVVGTEAVLHRVGKADAVAFLEFDQELLAPRYRAAEQAIALLARAARIVGGRRAGGRVLVQTRLPDHPVVAAALHADPGRVTEAEAPIRRAVGLPPYVALAAVSGEGGADFVAQLRDVDLVGPTDGRWLVKAPTHEQLARALAAATRPPARLRVEVDPLRV